MKNNMNNNKNNNEEAARMEAMAVDFKSMSLEMHSHEGEMRKMKEALLKQIGCTEETSKVWIVQVTQKSL